MPTCIPWTRNVKPASQHLRRCLLKVSRWRRLKDQHVKRCEGYRCERVKSLKGLKDLSPSCLVLSSPTISRAGSSILPPQWKQTKYGLLIKTWGSCHPRRESTETPESAPENGLDALWVDAFGSHAGLSFLEGTPIGGCGGGPNKKIH